MSECVAHIPLSNDTVKRRISEMSVDINEKVCQKFALQVDELTDCSSKSQSLAFGRFIESGAIGEQFLFCWEMKLSTTGFQCCRLVLE